METAAALDPRARQKAERCFALARSTTFDGEREAAVAKGIAIVEKAGLDPDTFDVPGRPREKKSGGTCSLCGKLAGECLFGAPCHECAPPDPGVHPRPFWSERDKAPQFYSSADVSEVMARFNAAMRDRASGMAPPGDAVRRMRDAIDEFVSRAAESGSGVAAAFEAGRFDAAMRARPAMQAQWARWPDLNACVDFLSSRGFLVYDMGLFPDDNGPRWFAPGRLEGDRLTDEALRTLADEVEGR